MNEKKFFKTLNNATYENEITWNKLPKNNYQKVTMISDGIQNAFYTDYEEGTKIVIYMYKTYIEDLDSSDLDIYISFVDDNFDYMYEITPSDLSDLQADIFKLYRYIQKTTHGIDKLFENFVDRYDSE